MAKEQTEMTGAEMVIKAMLDNDTDTVFGYPGGAVLPIYDALFQQNRLRHILVRHEQGAGHAGRRLCALNRQSRCDARHIWPRCNQCGHRSHRCNARFHSAGLCHRTGAKPPDCTDAFQEADVTGITRSCTKHNYLIKDVNDVGRIMNEAFHVAQTGRPGPVVVDIPKDILNAIGTYKDKTTAKRQSYNPVKNQTKSWLNARLI